MGTIVANPMITLNGVAGRPEAWQFDYVSPRKPVVDELRKLKQNTNGELNIIDSPTLVRSLLEVGLIDRLAFMIYPLVLDDGVRLFDSVNGRTDLDLESTATLPSGVLHLTYIPADKGTATQSDRSEP